MKQKRYHDHFETIAKRAHEIQCDEGYENYSISRVCVNNDEGWILVELSHEIFGSSDEIIFPISYITDPDWEDRELMDTHEREKKLLERQKAEDARIL